MSKKMPVVVQIILIALVVFIMDFIFTSQSNISILVALLFWAGVGQGLIAMSAAADLAQGKWIKSIKPYMQEYYPLLAMFPIIFIIFSIHAPAYRWSWEPGAWLNLPFFMIRNTIAYLLPFIVAHFYVTASRKSSEKTQLAAVLYIVSFVVCQSFMAYDQVMSFEYPWINTLFGAFFFIEAMYAGIAFSIFLTGFLSWKDSARFRSSFQDFTLMLMGFALMWAGLFYSQYLVIWYGNIPEEVSYIATRMEDPMIEKMGIFTLITLFLIPFLLLVSRKIKSTIPVVFGIAFLVLAGLVIERLIYLIPVGDLSVMGVMMPLVLMGIPFLALLRSQYRSIK